MTRASRRVIHAWCMYDWASSAFVTTIMAALFPPFFRSLATDAGASAGDATALWAYTTALALLVIALASPVMGALADITNAKKRFAGAFAALGILSTASFITIGSGNWPLAMGLYIAGNIGFAGANLFYESLLPHIAGPGEIDRVSARGYALGYVGGGLLLLINVGWVMAPQRFGMPSVDFALRASFLSVAIWWTLFSLPFFRHVPEPAGTGPRVYGGQALREGIARPIATLRAVRRYPQLFLFLLAFWCYNDGIGTIVKMATAYGDEIGIGLTDMTAALVITQFVGIPCAFLFGRLSGFMGAKRAIMIGLVGYSLISIGAWFMQTAVHFYILAGAVGMVQGGTQALSRSLYGAMVPRGRSAEFFGFFSTSSRLAGIAGPLLFGIISQATGGSRLSILSLVIFFLVGMALLSRVDVEQGIAASGEGARGVA